MSHAKNMDGNLAALDAYEAEQDKKTVASHELEVAKVKALIQTLDRRKAITPSMYTGVELVSEALSEHAKAAFLPLASFLAFRLDGFERLDDAADRMDLERLGRLTMDLMWPYLRDFAEKNAEDYLPQADGPERED